MWLAKLKYLAVIIIPVATYASINTSGWWTWGHIAYMLVILPLAEIALGRFESNFDEEEISQANKDLWYDFILYLQVPVQYGFLYYFLDHIATTENTMVSLLGKMTGMGLMSGVIAINAAHELGHRDQVHEKFMSKLLLLSTLYLHFYIEHNRGHHKNVGTREDPATARYGENIYSFWIRSLVYSYLSAWKIENQRLKVSGLKPWSMQNQMLQFQLIQAAFILLVYYAFGMIGVWGLLGSSLFGIILLETVNYIQHYGMLRALKQNGQYEKVNVNHSWNSAFPIGRILLFELARHSEHHFISTTKYQVLKHSDTSPQMPTGYTGMITMALIPPIWFRVMNPLVKKFNPIN